VLAWPSGEQAVSGITVRPAAGPPRDDAAAERSLRRLIPRTPAGIVIAAATLLGLGLRFYQLARPGHLLGVTEYDDGADFGSALRLVNGAIPYRDFITVQPPGITLLMLPAALLSKLTGTAWAMAAGRILTAAAGAAAVLLGGLLVRHRGVLAVVVTCGILAVYPGSVQSAHTVLLEPWLVLACLAGAVAVFDGDQLAGGRRLAWGGAALGFAGAIKVWAIIPVAVILVLSLPRPRQAARFLAGVAAGFLVPVLPFALAAPRALYDGVIVAQLTRSGIRVPFWFRIQQMTGLTAAHLSDATVAVAALLAVALVAGVFACAWLVTRRPPPALDWFGVVSAALVAAAFLLPADFYYHYPGFLAPFLALSLALPAARLLAGGPGAVLGRRLGELRLDRLRWSMAGLAGLVMVVLPFAVPRAEDAPTPVYLVAAVRQVIPPGACVLTDQASLLIAADRFSSGVPGCSLMVDGTGTDFVLGHGRNGFTAGRVPAVAAVWRQAFGTAQYALLTPVNTRRIAWTPALRSYFALHFVLVHGAWQPLSLYIRKGLRVQP
jgi:alpha-1,2-mannosyltransferase